MLPYDPEFSETDRHKLSMTPISPARKNETATLVGIRDVKLLRTHGSKQHEADSILKRCDTSKTCFTPPIQSVSTPQNTEPRKEPMRQDTLSIASSVPLNPKSCQKTMLNLKMLLIVAELRN